MEDVLIRLRRVPKYPGLTLCKDAASEIERLRAELAECKRDADRAEVERLRGVLVEVMEWTERYTAPGHPISTVIRAALANSDAARKGEGE